MQLAGCGSKIIGFGKKRKGRKQKKRKFKTDKENQIGFEVFDFGQKKDPLEKKQRKRRGKKKASRKKEDREYKR